MYQWSPVIGGFGSPLFHWVVISWEVWFKVVPSAVCWHTSVLLCFLIVDIHASGISIPLSLLMLFGWSLMWIASFTLVSINKLYLIPKQVVASLTGMLWNGRGLGTGKSCIPFVFFYPLLHRSSCLASVDFLSFSVSMVTWMVGCWLLRCCKKQSTLLRSRMVVSPM